MESNDFQCESSGSYNSQCEALLRKREALQINLTANNVVAIIKNN